MKDVYSLISDIKLEVKDLHINIFAFESEHKNKFQVLKAAAKIRKDLKRMIDDMEKIRNYVTEVRKELETFYDAQRDRAAELNKSKLAEIAQLETQLAELKASLI